MKQGEHYNSASSKRIRKWMARRGLTLEAAGKVLVWKGEAPYSKAALSRWAQGVIRVPKGIDYLVRLGNRGVINLCAK